MSIKVNAKLVRNAGLILAILVYSLIRFTIIRQGQLIGASYFFSTFDFIMIFIIGGTFCVLDVVSKHVKAHMDLDCFKNAKKVLIYGAMLAFGYSALISAVILALQDSICHFFIAGDNCKLTLLLLLPMFIFVSISAAFKGFFIGAKLSKQADLGLAAEMVISLIAVILVSSLFAKQGEKVAAVMFDYKIHNAYLSAGAALGLSIGAGIGLILDIVMFVMTSRRLVRIDETRRMVDIYDLSIQMMSEMLFLGLAMCLPLTSVLTGQVIYLKNMSSGVDGIDLYAAGSYFGVFGSLVTCIVLFTYVYSFFDKKALALAYEDNNKQELRSKVNNMIKLFFMYALPFVIMFIVLADVLCQGVMGVDSALSTNIIRTGAFAVVFYAFGIMFMNVLVALNKTLVAVVDGIIALVLFIFFTLFLLGKFSLGTNGLVMGFYAFSIIYAVLIYMSACSGLKSSPKLINGLLGPIVMTGIIGVISLALRLILGLFAPALVTVIVTLLISMIAMFILYVKLGITDYHHVCKSPISFILVPFGQIIGIFKHSR